MEFPTIEKVLERRKSRQLGNVKSIEKISDASLIVPMENHIISVGDNSKSIFNGCSKRARDLTHAQMNIMK